MVYVITVINVIKYTEVNIRTMNFKVSMLFGKLRKSLNLKLFIHLKEQIKYLRQISYLGAYKSMVYVSVNNIVPIVCKYNINKCLSIITGNFCQYTDCNFLTICCM